MRKVTCWNDMEQFGIILLTGEACALNMRGLCDVTAEGKKLLERFFGGQIVITEGANWNHRTTINGVGVEHVGTIMLPYDLIRHLAVFCLMQTGDETVVEMNDGSVWEMSSERLERTAPYGNVKRVWRKVPNDRNTHQMSGRTE